MADTPPVRVLLIKDGEKFYMRPLGDQPPVHVAYIDTANNKPNGQGEISSLIPGGGSEAEVLSLLDLAAKDMEAYVQSGNFDRDRLIAEQNQEIARLSQASQPVPANGV